MSRFSPTLFACQPMRTVLIRFCSTHTKMWAIQDVKKPKSWMSDRPTKFQVTHTTKYLDEGLNISSSIDVGRTIIQSRLMNWLTQMCVPSALKFALGLWQNVFTSSVKASEARRNTRRQNLQQKVGCRMIKAQETCEAEISYVSYSQTTTFDGRRCFIPRRRIQLTIHNDFERWL